MQRAPLVVAVPLVDRPAVQQVHQRELVLEPEYDDRLRHSESRECVQPFGPAEISLS